MSGSSAGMDGYYDSIWNKWVYSDGHTASFSVTLGEMVATHYQDGSSWVPWDTAPSWTATNSGVEQSLIVSGASAPQLSSGTTTVTVPPVPDFMNDRNVKNALTTAWNETNPNAPAVQRGQLGSIQQEQGGWIVKTDNPWWKFWADNYSIERFPAGTRDSINPTVRPVNAVGVFHGHPNTRAEGYSPDPSQADISWTQNTARVPHVIITHEGYKYVYP
jgi:hypothetical protein